MNRLKQSARREIMLRKGREHFIFRWHAGDEAALLRHFGELAKRFPTSGFTWHDAAVLSNSVRTDWLPRERDELP